MNYRKITSFIVTLAISCAAPAQNKIQFDKITVDDGLSQSHINWILQDNQGFIWFATNGGLNRFDGTQFKIFTHNTNDSSSISNNIINHIFEDDEGKLWISTQNGLNVYDKSTESFTWFLTDINDPKSLSDNQVTCTIKDNTGKYWIGTNGGGLNRYDPKTNEFVVFGHELNNPLSISSNHITCIEKDKYGYIWVGTADNGVNMLDPERGKFLRYVLTEFNQNESLSSNQINAIYEDNDGDLWVATSEGIDQIKPTINGRNLNNRDKVIHFHELLTPKNSTANKNVTSLYQGASGLIWFGTVNSGLGFFNKYTKSSKNYIVDANDESSIMSNNVTAVLDDRSGILWVGTNSGINIIDKLKDRFTWHKRMAGTGNTISSNNIMSIYKEKNGRLWLGTYDKGLTMYDPLPDVYTTYLDNDRIVEGESIKELTRLLAKYDKRKSRPKLTPISYLSHNRIQALLKDRQNRIWIGTGGGGINILYPNSGMIKQYRYDPDDPSSLSSDFVKCIFQDSKGKIWAGTEDGGLNLYENGKFRHFVSDENDIFSISSNNISALAEDDNGYIWIGTFGGGLNKYDPQKNKFTRYGRNENNVNSLSSNSIYCLYIDDEQKLWIGTAYGLNVLDIPTSRFSHIFKNDGLPSNSIYTILDDGTGRLWLSTNRGISRLDKQTRSIKNYDKEDGLQSTEFNPCAGFVASNGQMFFGSNNGYCTFYPANITDNQYKPEVIITDFKILNNKVPIGKPGSPLKKHISETDTLILSYKDVSISFEFVALNFTDSKKNQYAYMMENFEDKWNYSGNIRFANYTNLQPGEYIFRVKASNNDGIWNEEGRSLYIIVKPPYWKTWWFYSLLVVFVFTGVFLTIQLRTRALHKSKIILENQVRERTKQLEEQKKILEEANKEIIQQKNEIEKRNKLLKSKNQEISKAKKELDKINKQLVSTNLNLENMVQERTSTLQFTNEELKKANDELDLFIYRASHDLKGPIARLLGMTLLAKMDNKDEGLKEYIELIEKGAFDINKILNKLNNYHFINRETSQTEEIDFKKIINECKAYLYNYINKNDLKIKLVMEPGFRLRSDYVLMKIIIENLLENAVFFRKTKKVEIEINLRTTRKNIILSVEDNGLGILKEQQDKIFEMFYRGSEKSKGNGLGLYLVKKAVHKLRGNITVESEEGKYSCFIITLPKVIVPVELKSLVS